MKLKNNLAFAVLVGSLFASASAPAFDRDLTDDEVGNLEKNVKANPQNSMARRFLVHHFSAKSNWNKVAYYATPIPKDWPASTVVVAIKGFMEKGDGVAAAAAAGDYHGRFPVTTESKILEGRALLVAARKELNEPLKKQKAQSAFDVFKEAAQLAPKEPEPYLVWVAALREFWANSPEDALHVFKIYENASGDFQNYLSEKCELFVKASWWDQALVACQRSVKKFPENIQNFIYLAQAQKVKVDIEVAKKTLIDFLQDHPKVARAHFVLGNMYFEQKIYSLAAEQYQLTIQEGQAEAEVYLGLAQAEFFQKKYDEALKAYKINCKLNRAVASEFKNAAGQLRSEATKSLHNKYKNVISSCR